MPVFLPCVIPFWTSYPPFGRCPPNRIKLNPRERDKLREALTLAKIDHHAEAVEELDVDGILAFAERILPRASDLWVQATLDYKQRLQQLFFPEGVAFDGNRFNRTAATAPLFKYLAPSECADERVACQPKLEGRRSAFASFLAARYGGQPSPEPERRLVSRVGIEHVWRARRAKPTCLRITGRSHIERREMW